MTAISDDTWHIVRETQRVMAYNVSWSAYEAVLHALDHNKVWLTFDEPVLELRKVSYAHERARVMLTRLFMTATDEFNLPLISLGQFSWRSQRMRCALEADGSYYVARAEQMKAVWQVDLAIHPPPDLAIEIEVSRSEMDRMRIYGKLGVPEVWRYDGKDLSFWSLGGEGYLPIDCSVALPGVTPAYLGEFLAMRDTVCDTTIGRQFRASLADRWPERCVGF
jgi:Uma2 family endonuclease